LLDRGREDGRFGQSSRLVPSGSTLGFKLLNHVGDVIPGTQAASRRYFAPQSTKRSHL
jgi:hypothetical protein